MKNKNKALLLVLCAVMLVVGTVFATLAYLTDTDTATNTFTVGNVGLSLDEAEVNQDGTVKSDKRVQENAYHLLPGHTYIKDPTVTVEAGSEDACNEYQLCDDDQRTGLSQQGEVHTAFQC